MARQQLMRALIMSTTAAVSVMGVSAEAAMTIAGSPHDLSTPTWGQTLQQPHTGNFFDNFNQICVYCHTPHNANTANGGQLLWNRPLSTASYTLYQSPTFNSTMTAPDSISSSSLCLSCHDGTIAVDNVIRRPTTGNTVAASQHMKMTSGAGTCGSCHNENGPTTVAADKRHGFLGTDLSNDHPINMTYDPSVDPGLRAASAVTAAGLKLYSNKVQCASCHDPHVPREKAFLRISNAQSGLCTTCHTK